MSVYFHVEGLKELDAALGELSKGLARGVLKRVLMKAGKPIAEAASGLAPDDPRTQGKDLKSSIVVSTKLNNRQKALAKKDTKSFQTVYVGTNDPAGVQNEFGNEHQRMQAFMRPAWDSNKMTALAIIQWELGPEIIKTADRAAKRKAAKAAKEAAPEV